MSDVISSLEKVIRFTSARNGVLASNIANVDTPNYQAKDMKFNEVLGSEVSLAATHPRHIQTGPEGGAAGEVTAGSGQAWADKNNVELDQEVAKMTENGMLFQAAVTLLEKKIEMFKNALNTSK